MTRWLATLAVVVGCAGAEDTGDTAASTFVEVQGFFDRSCVASCHEGAAPSSGLNLSAGAARAQLVGVPSIELPEMMRVEGGDPDQSYLVAKLEGTFEALGGSGTAMPPGIVTSDAERALVRAWITEGASP